MNGKWFLLRFYAGICVMMDFGMGFSEISGQVVPKIFWGMAVGAHVWLFVLVMIAFKKE